MIDNSVDGLKKLIFLFLLGVDFKNLNSDLSFHDVVTCSCH